MAKLIDGGRNNMSKIKYLLMFYLLFIFYCNEATSLVECAEPATEFSIFLVQTLVIEEPKVILELHNLVDALAKLASKPGCPKSLPQLLEMIKNPAALSSSNAGKEDKARQSRDNKGPGLLPANREEFNTVDSIEPDPAGFHEQVSMLFTEWYRISELPVANDLASANFILQLHQNGLLKGDDLTDRIF